MIGRWLSGRPVIALSCAVTIVAALLAGPVAAQQRIAPSPHLIRYGKWLALGGSIAFGLLAQAQHAQADNAFNALTNYCFGDFNRCNTANGQYLDPVSEGYYQTSLAHDRQAGHWLAGGEALFLGAAAGFIWELTRPKGLPRNIPLEPDVTYTPTGTRVGLRLTF
ncbi:MAG: hypothetical protein ACHQXA_05965 [Gemmatimonadales bacterium]